MKKLIVVIGESGSGKTTLIAELTKRYPEQFRKVVTCTSRPMRVGEMDGEDYHFLPEVYFADNSDLVLTKKTEEGFCYGTRKSDLFPTTHHMLLTSKLTGVNKLVDMGYKSIIVVRIFISERLKVERMRQRGDSEGMISNRLHVDAETAAGIDLGLVPVIYLHANQKIEEKMEMVLQAC